ncbi:hypothetical protein IMCC26134_06920 [Verrucomicrobia bacterium IMCC26134]|nr:hypothetical protein IMCC26134_06920 [Verrucomicrobia bacterium IMCC26134]
MKGMVFTQLIEMADTMLGPDQVEAIIAKADLPSGGAYTAVGNYPHSEAVTLVGAFSEASGVPVPALLEGFGEHMLRFFHSNYPAFFSTCPDAFTFLESVETYVHVEVKKLYPDAELPRFSTYRMGPGRLRFDYYSSRHLENLAAGLIKGTLKLYNEYAVVTHDSIEGEHGPCVRFLIDKTTSSIQPSA